MPLYYGIFRVLALGSRSGFRTGVYGRGFGDLGLGCPAQYHLSMRTTSVCLGMHAWPGLGMFIGGLVLGVLSRGVGMLG